jgi:DNA-binding protein
LREPFGFAGDVSARYRSWEAGVMGYAFLFHLTGYVPDVPENRIKLSPQLPPEWNEMSFEGLSYGNSRFNLDVRRSDGNGRTITITTGPNAGFVLDLILPMSRIVTSVIVNGRATDFATAVNLYERMIVKVKDIDIPAGTKMEITVS